jgi:glycosyltransferase involved in cell wall biosynthesis
MIAERVRDGVEESGVPKRRWNVGMLFTHPIQYQVPLVRRLASHPWINLSVYFMTDTGMRRKYVRGYGETIKWDIPLLDGYRHKFLKNVSWNPDSNRPWSKINPSIVWELRRDQLDVLILNGYSSVTEWLAYAAAKASGIPLLFRGDVLLRSISNMIPTARLTDAARRAWCRGMDAVLSLSSTATEYYEHYQMPRDRIFWTPLSVDNESWMRQADALAPRKDEVKAKLGLPAGLPVILFVAHMRANKRPLDVVEGARRAKTGASVVLVGNGPLYDEVRRHCSAEGLSNVYPVGAKNQTELPEYYAAADLFVLPSSAGEVTPLVIHEAMCFGLPLVMSDAIPSARDFVREGENGHTFPVGDLDRLARCFDLILSDETRRLALGAKSRAIIGEWNYDVCVENTVNALALVTGGA